MTTPGVEAALQAAARWSLPPLLVAPALLFVPKSDGAIPLVIGHLALLVIFGLVATMALERFLSATWFGDLSPLPRSLWAAGAIVALGTGMVALVTLASSAALRLDPSLQFLQLLSALDIAWAAGATALGWTMLRSRRAGWMTGSVVVAVCLWSVWRYLDEVGLGPGGEWRVAAEAMWTYILPYDIMAAVVAVTSLVLGARRRAGDRKTGGGSVVIPAVEAPQPHHRPR